MKSALVRILGHPATLIHGDTLVLDRWLWIRHHLQAVPPGSKSLIDVGCGTGAFTIGAARRGYRALGLSWDERNQRFGGERAKLCRAPLATFDVLDVRNLDVRADMRGKFDVAICLECIEHIMNDQKLMVDIGACLKPGGRLLLTTPNIEFRPMNRDDCHISLVEDGGHVRRGYGPDDLKRIAAAAGLEVVEIGYCSGLLSQKLTGFLRTVSKHTASLFGWVLILPLRWIPPLLDGIATRTVRWPGYSITLVARKPA